MIKNYLLIAFRNILKNKFFSVINIFGLAVGISVSLLLFQYVKFENGFDTWYENYDSKYRVNLEIQKGDETVSKSARTAPAFGQTLLDELPEVEQFTRAVILGEAIASFEENHFREKNILLADDKFFDFFGFQLISGNPQVDMLEPMGVYISETVANSLFMDENPVSKGIKLNSPNLDGTAEFIIKGVFQDQPSNSHIRPNILVSYVTLHAFIGKQIDESWDWTNLYTYIAVTQATDIDYLSNQIDELISSKVGKSIAERNETWHLDLQPVSDIHTNNSYTGEFEIGIDGGNLKYYQIIAFLILLIAYVNFINLYTAKSINRLREITIRKISGARRGQLIFQFLGETFILNLLGFLAALTILQFSKPLLGYFGIQSLTGVVSIASILPLALIILLVGTLVSGSYPAFVMSGWKISLGITNNRQLSFGGLEIRKGLLGIQFLISSLLIAGTFTIYNQIKFMNGYDLGFNKEEKLVVKSPRVDQKQSSESLTPFKNSLLSYADIGGFAVMDEIPGNEIYWKTNEFRRDKEESSDATFAFLNIDENYFDLFEVEVVAGRKFIPEIDKELNTCVVNETATLALNFENPAEAAGAKVFMGEFEVEIIGIVKDFHQEGLKKPIFPQLFRYEDYHMNYMVLDINTNDMAETMHFVESQFKKIYPDSPFEYYFLDEYYNAQYQAENLFRKVFTTFSILAIVVACLGLIGISYQNLLEKTKEIGVRKVLGATLSDLIFSLSKSYLVLAVVCYLISMPIAYFYFDGWLSQFTERIQLGWWFFVIPVISLLLAISLSIVFQTLRAAMANPAKSLKYE